MQCRHTGRSFCGYRPIKPCSVTTCSADVKEVCSRYVYSLPVVLQTKPVHSSVSSVSLETKCCLLIATTSELLTTGSPKEETQLVKSPSSERQYSKPTGLQQVNKCFYPRPWFSQCFKKLGLLDDNIVPQRKSSMGGGLLIYEGAFVPISWLLLHTKNGVDNLYMEELNEWHTDSSLKRNSMHQV